MKKMNLQLKLGTFSSFRERQQKDGLTKYQVL